MPVQHYLEQHLHKNGLGEGEGSLLNGFEWHALDHTVHIYFLFDTRDKY